MENSNTQMKLKKELEVCIFTSYEIMGIDTCSGNDAHFWRKWHTGRMQDSTKPKEKKTDKK